MGRYRLLPTPAQEAVLRIHCGHARFTWNLAVEQHSHWHPGRTGAPGYAEQCRQLTAARAEHEWLRAGSQTVQQQALRDFARAMAAFFDPKNPARRPTWRKAGRYEGFRIVGRGRQWDIRRMSRKVGQVWVPKAGWVRFRWSRAVPPGVKAGLNRGILRSGWGLLVRRLEDKAPGRVEKINPVYTSQTCSGCGHRDPESRESQSRFRCRACGLKINADVNAARNIAAGHAVTARGGDGITRPVNREPQLLLQSW
jgi:transposase